MIINALKAKFYTSYGYFLKWIIAWLNAWYLAFQKERWDWYSSYFRYSSDLLKMWNDSLLLRILHWRWDNYVNWWRLWVVLIDFLMIIWNVAEIMLFYD